MNRSVTAADVERHLRALQHIADANHGTRAAGTGGDRATADYIARQLRDDGWDVHFQTVRFPFFALHGTPRVADLKRPSEFDVLEYSGSGDISAEVRPLDTPACNAAALEPVQKGEIALVARGTCTFRTKVVAAQHAGAAALVVVDRDAESDPVRATLGTPDGIHIPAVVVSAPAGAKLAHADGPITLSIDTTSERRATRDVIAETQKRQRVVMAGAHLDSVTAGPGINDDGSGVAALLAIAPQLAHQPGLRLGFWAAEELGLYGSRAYVTDLSENERDQIAGYLNLDMVGSPHPRPEVYDGDNRIERLLRAAYPGDEGEIDLHADSDHAAFERAGIPVGGLFTGASPKTDPCYHRACDTLRNANAPMAARMARATATALQQLSH